MREAEQNPPLPMANAYWVVPGRLLAGGYPGDGNPEPTRRRLERFLSMGIQAYIDLTEIGASGRHSYVPILRELVDPQQLHYHNPAIRDMGLPTRERMIETLDLIDAALERGDSAFVHCKAGVGRTGMVIGCYLARHGQTGEAALEELTRLRRNSATSLWPSPETPQQRDLVRNWPAGE